MFRVNLSLNPILSCRVSIYPGVEASLNNTKTPLVNIGDIPYTNADESEVPNTVNQSSLKVIYEDQEQTAQQHDRAVITLTATSQIIGSKHASDISNSKQADRHSTSRRLKRHNSIEPARPFRSIRHTSLEPANSTRSIWYDSLEAVRLSRATRHTSSNPAHLRRSRASKRLIRAADGSFTQNSQVEERHARIDLRAETLRQTMSVVELRERLLSQIWRPSRKFFRYSSRQVTTIMAHQEEDMDELAT